MSRRIKDDWTGKKIRGLTVIRWEDCKGWLCRCECGKELWAPTNGIENRIGCGSCVKKGPKGIRLASRVPKTIISLMFPEKPNDDHRATSASRYISSIKSNAKKDGREMCLSDFEILEIISSPCVYCGHNVEFPKERNGIDRINNNDGYIKTNCVSCCKYCNSAKKDLTFDKFMLLIQRMFFHTKGLKHRINKEGKIIQ